MNWKAITIGFIISSVLGILLSFVVPVIGGIISTFLAAILVGYMVNKSIGNGALNAAVMGILGGLIEAIILLIAGTALAGVKGLLIAILGVMVIALFTILHILIAALGGAIGSVIKK